MKPKDILLLQLAGPSMVHHKCFLQVQVAFVMAMLKY